jgi:uncharacterized protein YbjT (DUF2867 family)
MERGRIGLLGATGYTGQRVLRELRPHAAKSRPWSGETAADAGRVRSLRSGIFRWQRLMSPRRPTSPGSWSQASHGL